MKKEIFSRFDEMVQSDEVIIASSTSALPGSSFSEQMKRKSQVIVVHPVSVYCTEYLHDAVRSLSRVIQYLPVYHHFICISLKIY